MSLKTPVLFVFNSLQSVFAQFGCEHFFKLKNYFDKSQSLALHFVPITNHRHEGIEKRALKIKEQIDKLKLAQEAHVIAYSVAGLDFRHYLVHHSTNRFKSLTTVATPHKGSILTKALLTKKIEDAVLRNMMRLIGISNEAFEELAPDNIAAFNHQTVNVKDTQYFSIGGERLPNQSSEFLRAANRLLFEEGRELLRSNIKHKKGQEKSLGEEVPLDNDGIFTHEEVHWGTHLVNFNADHAELVGLRYGHNPQPQFALLHQHLHALSSQK